MLETSESPVSNPVVRANRWLVVMLAAMFSCGLLLIGLLILRGDTPQRALALNGWSVVPAVFKAEYKDDSWGPMGRAFLRARERDDGDIYGIFFDERRKFQYPPTSLLVFLLAPESWLGNDNFKRTDRDTRLTGAPLLFLRSLSQVSVLLTIAAAIAIFEIGLRRLPGARDVSKGWRLARISMLAVLGLSFYPVVKAHDLGQIQALLNCLTALGVLAHVLGWRASGGFMLGLCCLVKPQFAVVPIWALLRRNWRALGGFIAAALPLGLVSLAVFGWDNHIRYIGVVREISKAGEAYWPNQSFNGFLNRLLGHGDPLNFSFFEFAPYHPLVHAATVGTSLLILGLAFYKRKSPAFHPQLDLAVIIAAATVASPVAWEHHYGAFLPLFALALPACLGLGSSARITGLICGACFLAIGSAVLATDILLSPKWFSLPASHLFYGAVLFFGLLIYLRGRGETTTPTPAGS
ncbi:MAG: glycosyltransferase family 87 protein [Luteolibacter sp.]|jgi:hypothetical protein|nr:glycosyltransferase family 87 protein [Luteolibacter sp.]